MWPYLGSKGKIINMYPAPDPRYDTIVEPFAGSARYALRYFEYNVILVDADPLVIDVWNYLIGASEKDILSLPILDRRERLSDYKSLTAAERALIGWCRSRGSDKRPRTGVAGNLDSWEQDQKRIATNLYKIKHWKAINATYDCIGDYKVNWFIDPPYQKGGEQYQYSIPIMAYHDLGLWCLARQGQVIVCEHNSANWLPFKRLSHLPSQGQKYANMELIYFRRT